MNLPKQVNPDSVIINMPRYFEDAQSIADNLLQGRVVIVDFKYLDANIKQRMVSFLEGTLFGIDGKLVVLREDIAVLLPEGALAEKKEQPALTPVK